MLKQKNSTLKALRKHRRRSHTIRFFRNVLIAFFILVILAVAAGFIYTWYMGQHSIVKDTAVPTKTTAKTTNTEPVQLAPNAKEGVSIQSLTTPVQPGANASIDIQTNRDSTCTITVVYNNVPSKDAGLSPKTADEYGLASWSWTVGSTVPVGKWPVTVTCVWNKKTALVIGDLIIQK
jgi:hypothetical protein